MLAKTLRPSITPSSSTMRSFSSKIRSADSLVISVAVSTEMPTSAARSAGASLIPSPMNPTTCPLPRRTRMTRSLWAGERRGERASPCPLPRPVRRRTSSPRRHPTTWGLLRGQRLAHFAADKVVIPGEDFYRHAMLVQRREGGCCGVLGRVQEGDVPPEYEFALVILAQICFPDSSFVATASTRKPSLLRSSYSRFRPTT